MPIITITKSDSKAIDIWAWLDMQRGLFKSQPLAFMFRHFQLRLHRYLQSDSM